MAQLEAALASTSDRLTYAEYSLYDIAVHTSWNPEKQEGYRFRIGSIFEATEGGPAWSTEVLGYTSPAAAVTAAYRSTSDLESYQKTQIYDAHEKRWLGSLSELLPPGTQPKSRRIAKLGQVYRPVGSNQPDEN